MIKFGERLRNIRLAKGLSSPQLELLSGVNQSTISRIESNMRSPSIETLLKICDALEISVSDLFENNETLPLDMLNLINTAKKLFPQQRKKVTEIIESFLK